MFIQHTFTSWFITTFNRANDRFMSLYSIRKLSFTTIDTKWVIFFYMLSDWLIFLEFCSTDSTTSWEFFTILKVVSKFFSSTMKIAIWTLYFTIRALVYMISKIYYFKSLITTNWFIWTIDFNIIKYF